MSNESGSPIVGTSAGGGSVPRMGVPRWLILLGVVVALVAISFGVQSFRTRANTNGNHANGAATLATDADQERWMATATGQLHEMEQTSSTLQTTVTSLKEQLAKLQKRLDHVGLKEVTQKERLRLPPPPESLPPVQLQGTKTKPFPGKAILAQSSSQPPGPPVARPLKKKPTPSNVVAEITGPVNPIRLFAPAHVEEQEPELVTYRIPTGMIIPMRLLSGLDAPTGGGVNDPHPVLMEVVDLSILPNTFQMNMEACFLLGEGKGDLSTERAFIRVLTLSCIDEAHETTDLAVKGTVTGEDGKAGMRGRVVLRDGAILARALAAGFIDGVGRAFQPFRQGFFISRDPDESFNFPNPGQVGIAGMAGGFSQAAAVLAQRYVEMANQIFPVIEIDADRKADILITEGIDIQKPVL
ncbi:MAG: hypothetical protein NPIRA02_00680 [Nitrospirales bacterium]|nr:MAG: hypothetical protein NPIRA02_00680 [Nitrospirales bacterium]